eukprot:GHVU01068224.1.p1 GENE.GHVU01068224.1~~GHVU01068224.1.p1  ORF type:complete len:189 (+),score=31.41 GHVU01068224.1:292-858(+)
MEASKKPEFGDWSTSCESEKEKVVKNLTRLQEAAEVFDALSRYEEQVGRLVAPLLPAPHMKTDFAEEMLKKLKEFRKQVSERISDAIPKLSCMLENSPITVDGNTVTVVDDPESGVKCGKQQCPSYKFSMIFRPTASNEDIFAKLRETFASVLRGYNVLCLAMGASGSGKTTTMNGNDGVIPRTIMFM